MNAKLPPQNIDAERSVLGAILIDKDAIINVAELLRPEYFYSEAHKDIYDAIVSLYEKRQPIDVVTLTNQLKRTKKLVSIGGAAMIAELSNISSTSANVVTYAKIVKESAIKRAIISLSSELSEMAFDEGNDASQVVDKAEQRIFELSQNQTSKSFVPIKEALADSFERLDELQKNSGQLRGVTTGFSDLDNLLAGSCNE